MEIDLCNNGGKDADKIPTRRDTSSSFLCYFRACLVFFFAVDYALLFSSFHRFNNIDECGKCPIPYEKYGIFNTRKSIMV